MNEITIVEFAGIGFVEVFSDNFQSVYRNVNLNGHVVDIIVNKYGGRDYSLCVDDVLVFSGLRDRYAMPKVIEVLKDLQGGQWAT